MRVPVKLDTISDIGAFTDIVKNVKCDVTLVGKDENGNDWKLSAKSLFCSIMVVASKQRHREHTAHDVDWSTIYCECDEDIYSLIADFVII